MGAPIDGFGVGTDMSVSRDAPALDMAYKLVEYAGRSRLKLSTGKALLPGRKQIFRVERDSAADHDVLGRRDEELVGRPLLQQVMAGGQRTAAGRVSLDEARVYATRELKRLPPRIRDSSWRVLLYAVEISTGLRKTRIGSGSSTSLRWCIDERRASGRTPRRRSPE